MFQLMISCLVLIMSPYLYACSVCGFGQDGSQWAFIFTTGLLTFLPLIMMWLIYYFIKKHIRKNEKQA